MGHLGSRVSALLDGRLGPAEEERAWEHVHVCHPCRDAVEREGWVKTRLAQLSLGPAAAPESLKSSLRERSGALLPPAFPTAARSRSRGLVAIGGGAASACVVGVLALGLSGPSRVDPRPPTTDLSRPMGPIAPVKSVEPRAPRGGRLVVLHEKMPS